LRFLTRSLVGIFLLCLTAGLIGFALNTFYKAAAERSAQADRSRTPQERVFAVNVGTLTLQDATPVITAFGDVASRRTLDIRAAVNGQVIELAPGFRDGGTVAAGEVLLRVDPADAQAALDITSAELAEAQASAREAQTSAELAVTDLEAATQTRDLRANALIRQQDLQERGAGTGSAVEQAEIALASADQAVVGRRQALAQANSQRDLALIAVDRRRIAQREAERVLAETTIRAPYDGLLTAATVVPGGLVSQNEQVGSLIDTSALEVAFRVSNAQYARLIGPRGALIATTVETTLSLQDFPLTITGTLDRAGAQVGDGQTGRLLYATLDGSGAEALRPGDFLTVSIAEPVLQNVAVVPATAVTQQGNMLFLGVDDRLEAHRVAILRRQGNELIVGDVPEGRMFARETPAQIGPGVKIRPIQPGAEMAAPEMVEMTDDLRAQLVAALDANTGMPQNVRTRMRERLAGQRVPQEMVDRLLGGSGPPGATPPAETAAIVLDPDRKAKLIAFVEANQRMPQDVKTRILSQLNAEEVPTEVVSRLESRMGG